MSKKLSDEEDFTSPDPKGAKPQPAPLAAKAVEPSGQGGRYIRDPQTGERVLVERTAV